MPTAVATTGKRFVTTLISPLKVTPSKKPANRSIPASRCIWSASLNCRKQSKDNFWHENPHGMSVPIWHARFGYPASVLALLIGNLPYLLISRLSPDGTSCAQGGLSANTLQGTFLHFQVCAPFSESVFRILLLHRANPASLPR